MNPISSSTLHEAVERALAAEAALERAERERDQYISACATENRLREAAEARAQKAEAVVVLEIEQRQKAEEDRHGWYVELMEERGRRVKAETKLERAEAVVEAARNWVQIAENHTTPLPVPEPERLRVALAALDEQETGGDAHGAGNQRDTAGTQINDLRVTGRGAGTSPAASLDEQEQA